MLLGKGALVRRRPAVVWPGEGGRGGRERVVPEFGAPLVELLVVAGRRNGRAGVARDCADLRICWRPPDPGDAERPFDLVVVRLQILVGDRPVGQVRARDIALDGVRPELVLGHARQPAGPVRGTAAHHLRHRAEELDPRLASSADARKVRGLSSGIGPEVVAMDVGQLVGAELLRFPPGSASPGSTTRKPRLGQHLRRGRAGGARRQ